MIATGRRPPRNFGSGSIPTLQSSIQAGIGRVDAQDRVSSSAMADRNNPVAIYDFTWMWRELSVDHLRN
jgi:hypothetical protein